MDSEPEPTRKEKLAQKLENFPLLRQLVFEFWFRLVFISFLLGAVFLGLFLPKMWTLSRPGFKPVIKVSGLDLVQAWSLKRSALKAAAAGKDDDAAYAWQAAIANNAADPDLFRGSLRHLLNTRRVSQKSIGTAVGQTLFLLRLTETNQVDLELAAQVYEKFQLYDWLADLLKPFEDKLTPQLSGTYLKALFNLEEMEKFARFWKKVDTQTRGNPELALYQAAYLAGWGPPETSGDARQKIESALTDPLLQTTARRLQMAVSGHVGDAAGYKRALEKLEERNEDTLLDRLGLWRVLASTGSKSEAKALALAYSDPPVSAMEALRLVSVFISLDMTDHALDFLARYTPEFGYAAQLWLIYADLLIDGKRWDDLRTLALRMRKDDSLQDTLAGYSYFLEGRAELAQDRHSLAGEAFAKASRLPFENANLGLLAAINLIRFGFPAEGRDILGNLEKKFESTPDYWNALFLAAHGAKEPELMLRAAQKAFELQPGNRIFINNYAAALLYNRERPEEAIKLTLQILSQNPQSVGARINHVLALLLSQRVDEAESLLKTVNPDTLSSLEKTSVHLGWFEIYLRRKNYANARQASQQIERAHLFSPQLKWLEKAEEEIAAQTERKS